MRATEETQRLLFERHVAQKVRRPGGRTSEPKKWSKDDSSRFETNFRQLFLK